MTGQGATAFAQVDADGTGDTFGVDAGVPAETLVLGRDNGVAQGRGDRVGSDLPAELIPAPRKDLAVAVQQSDRTTGPRVQKCRMIRQCGGEIQNGQPDNHGCDESQAPCHPPD